MRNAKHQQELRRAVLQLSRHGDEDIGAVLARLDVRQRDRLRALLGELGRIGPAAGTAPARDEATQEHRLQAFLRRTPAPFAERFQAALNDAGQLHAPGSAASAPASRMTAKTAAVVAAAIAGYVRTSAPAAQESQPRAASLFARWFGNGARP